MTKKKEITEGKVDKEYIISQIIKMELEIISAISKGHKASDDDEFQIHRELLLYYKKLIFKNEQ